VILDTHVLLWLDRNDPALGPTARNVIEQAWRAGQVAVCAISFWEVAMLAERGRITLPVPINRWRADWLKAGLTEIPLNGDIALQSSQLVNLHRDPADRFIIATAMNSNTSLLTADGKILEWAGELERLNAGI
jgi:PIN domain nuclease of toxin-antitoxin system